MTLTDLQALREEAQQKLDPQLSGKTRILVGTGTCGLASGAGKVLAELEKEVNRLGLSDSIEIRHTGCIGLCQYEPLVEVHEPGKRKVTYVQLDPQKVRVIARYHLNGGKPVGAYTLSGLDTKTGQPLDHTHDYPVSYLDDHPFFQHQTRVVLRNCGVIDPGDISEYIAKGGYEALNKSLTEMSPDDIVQTIKDSGLRGRGGAGFPVGVKWGFVAANKTPCQRYVCCNADEGDPGAFMDRAVLEGDPHSVLEAMAIAGCAIGADQGYIYVRAEYPVAVAHLNTAIAQAREMGFLGKNIFGTRFSFDIELRLGAGAFVCGEETALMTSIEGKRGEPRPRPPFPAVEGLFRSPTVLNNVETFANVPQIILNGADWFRSTGTDRSPGTKVFALGGKITNTGLVEIPMGTPLRKVVEEIGGGVAGGKAFKAAQTGGPSGGCIPLSHFDIPIEYDTLTAIGSMMGSGGLIIMDEDSCMVDIAKFFLSFTVEESCGKCTPCRIGVKRLYEMVDRITEGQAEVEDLEKLEELCLYIKDNALCGLGQTAPNPVLSTLRFFKDEYLSHVVDKRCPTGVCKGLLSYQVDPEKCRGCTLCTKVCPVGAISGIIRKPHNIDIDHCVKCGACIITCKFDAIYKH